jgi:hypothetical protein
MRDDGMNCEALQKALRQGCELTRDQSAHIDECDACMETWLTAALEAKPAVRIPDDFAARVSAGLPAHPAKRATTRRPQHLGLTTAVAFITVLLAVWFSGATPMNSWVGLLFVMLVASEVAGLALWLGPGWMRR